MKRSGFFSIGVILLLISCVGKNSRTQEVNGENVPMRYARSFSVVQMPEYKVVDVRNPWDTTCLLHRYILVPDSLELPDHLPEGTVVRTPLRNVAAYSSIHCCMIEMLNQQTTLTGVCEPRYVTMEWVKQGVKDHRIVDLGEAASPNVEQIIRLQPQAIITSPIQGMAYGRISQLNIPLIETVDYMEESPLARSEWIKFCALFFQQEDLADSLFNEIEKEYLAIKAITDTMRIRPSVLSELKTGSVWYVPGGKSHMATMFADAGANYIWKDDTHSGSLPLSFEAVLSKASKADYWLIKGVHSLSYHSLKNEYSPYEQFLAFQKNNVYFVHTTQTRYYEDLTTKPHLILKEMLALFHPDLMPGYHFQYYQLLEK